MWPFKKKLSLVSTGIFTDFKDCHSHILPGVDDGVDTMEHALSILEYYETLGVQSVKCTPHIMEDIPNTTEALKARFEELKAAYKGPIELSLAAEYMLDPLFVKRLEDDDLLFWNENTKTVLVETTSYKEPENFNEIIALMNKKGYKILLAHPERYEYMDTERIWELKRFGLKFQLNVMSLVDAYGGMSVQKAQWGIVNGIYSCYGSDIHSLNYFRHMVNRKTLDSKWVDEYMPKR